MVLSLAVIVDLRTSRADIRTHGAAVGGSAEGKQGQTAFGQAGQAEFLAEIFAGHDVELRRKRSAESGIGVAEAALIIHCGRNGLRVTDGVLA